MGTLMGRDVGEVRHCVNEKESHDLVNCCTFDQIYHFDTISQVKLFKHGVKTSVPETNVAAIYGGSRLVAEAPEMR